MKRRLQEVKYYLSAISNFLAAVGGGMILGKGVNIIDTPFLHGGSILAFILGTTFGLLFLQIIPKKIATPIARWFSILAGVISLCLLVIFNIYSTENRLTNLPGIIFFFLLSVRFGFWFYSRVLRAASVAGQQQRIAWVELGYYSGMIAGLILWNIIGLEFGIGTALIIDACLQFTAGYIDLYGNQNDSSTVQPSNIKIIADKKFIKFNDKWYWKLTLSVVLLTIGTQVVIFNLAHQANESITSYVLGFYYFGVSVAAYFCRVFNIQMEWRISNNQVMHPFFILHFKEKIEKINAICGYIILTSCISISVIGVVNFHLGLGNLSTCILLAFVTIAAFFYEIFALSLLDKIGLHEKNTNQTGLVIRTYGCMGLGAGIGFWLLSIFNNSALGLIGLVLICAISIVFLTYRKIPNNNLPSLTQHSLNI